MCMVGGYYHQLKFIFFLSGFFNVFLELTFWKTNFGNLLNKEERKNSNSFNLQKEKNMLEKPKKPETDSQIERRMAAKGGGRLEGGGIEQEGKRLMDMDSSDDCWGGGTKWQWKKYKRIKLNLKKEKRKT